MDCGTVSNLIARIGCHLNNTLVAEMAAPVFLFPVCIAGLS